MGIIKVNLKLFYQRRIFWFFYALLIFLSPSILLGRVYSLTLVISFSIGMIVADLQKDVLTKPFSFVLPGYRKIPRLFILGMGIILNLLMAHRFLRGLGFFSLQTFLIFLALFCLGLLMYLFGVLFSLSPSVSQFSALAFVVVSFFRFPRFIQFATQTVPFVTIALGAAALALIWRWLAADSFARTYCGQIILGLGDGFNLAKTRKYNAKRAAEKLARKKYAGAGRSEEFVVRTIQRLASHNPIRNALGSGYVVMGNFGSDWKGGVISLIIMAVFFGYFLGGVGRCYIFMVSALLIARVDLHAHRTILLPRGRREYFFNAAFLGVGLAVVVTLLNAALSGIMAGLTPFLPPLVWGQDVFQYFPPDIRQLSLCPILIFVAFGFMILFPKRRHLLMLVIGMIGLWMTFEFGESKSLLLALGSGGRWLLMSASLLFFLLILARYCRNKDLME